MNISNIIIPILVLFILFYGYNKKVVLYDSFIKGAKEGLVMTFNIFAPILAMTFAINIFINSGFIDFILQWIKPLLNNYDLSSSVIPMAIMRPISGSATLVILNNIYETLGPDSTSGLLASVIQGCTDTTFYVITLYFGSIKIKNIKYSLNVGLFADLVGIIVAFLITYIFFF